VKTEDEGSPELTDLDRIAETSKKSLNKLQSLVDDLKVVEEHEKGLLGE
jgi:hypothetical protein